MAAPKAVRGEQKGGKFMAEKKPVKMMTTEKKPVTKDGGNKKKKAKKSSESYKIYIYKVLKQVGLLAAGFWIACSYDAEVGIFSNLRWRCVFID